MEPLGARERTLPTHVQREFGDYLKCGRLEHGFLRVRCADCHAERLVAFSCKRRRFCPSCGARRMAEGAALLVDEVLPRAPMRQWVQCVPFALRYLFATAPAVMGHVLGIVSRAIASHLIKADGYHQETAQTGAVTLIQRFGSALNLTEQECRGYMRQNQEIALKAKELQLPQTWAELAQQNELLRAIHAAAPGAPPEDSIGDLIQKAPNGIALKDYQHLSSMQ